MNIGNVEIKGIATLAPMAGFTDRAMREICALLGASYFTSEMVSAKGLIYGSKKTFELIGYSNLKKPFAVQLFGSEPEDFASAITLLNDFMPDVIDINMGCPATKIIKEGSGCALMKNPDLCARIVDAAKSVCPVPITVKIRAGWDSSELNAPLVAKMCSEAGADAITIHGRTRAQGYSGISDIKVIKKVKDSVKIPVIGNGDITSAQDARNMMEYSGCDMVAIGRGAVGNPWIFKEINKDLFPLSDSIPPTIKEKCDIMKLHIKKICDYKGDQRGIKEARKHLAGYIKGIPGAAQFRKIAFTAENKADLFNLCDEIKDTIL